MGKLTNAVREQIVQNATKGLFSKEFSELEQRERELGDDIFFKHVAKPEQYAVMKKLPAEFFQSQDHVRCWIGKEAGETERKNIKMTESRRTPAFAGGYSTVTVIDAALFDRFVKLTNERNELDNKRREIVRQVTGVVNSVSTTKRLLEIWPECAPFMPKTEEVNRNVPAVLVANLTSALREAGVQFVDSAQ